MLTDCDGVVLFKLVCAPPVVAKTGIVKVVEQ